MDKMKNYKIYTEGNYFYIIDTATAKVYEAHKKNVLVVKDTEVKGIFRFKNVEGFKDTKSVKLQNIQKESGVTYTASEFETFYKENTGNFSTPGAPGASAYQVWLDEGNTGTEQEFIDSLKGDKGDTGDMPLTEIDAYLGNFYNPSIVALNRRGVNDSAEIERRLRYVQDDIDNLGYTPLLLMTPSFKAENKIYSVIPDDGSGDFTFSRNSSATYIEDGIIKTAQPNVPRFQDGKILIEGQSTNVNILSNNFNATGSNLSVLGTTTNTYSPWLTTNIETLVDGSSTTLGSFLIKAININCNNFISVSLIVEKSTAENVSYNFSGINFRFKFNFVSKAVIPLAKVASYTVKEITNNVFLLQVVSTNISFSGDVQFSSGSVLDNTTTESKKGIASYAFLQVEEDRLPSSLIPTDGTAVTRLADVATVTPPTGVTEIIETIDGIDNTITTIPPTYQLPIGEINKVIMH